jgi:hypothetical protein
MGVTESPLSRLYRTSSADKPPLRIGLLLDTPQLAAWCVRIIEDILRSTFAELRLLIYNSTAGMPDLPGSSTYDHAVRLLKETQARELLFRCYAAWDAVCLQNRQDDPLAVYDYSQPLANIPALEATPITHGFTDSFSPDVVAAIRAYDLDVLIRFGFHRLRGNVLQASRYGVWSVHHGDTDYYRGGPAHFWELVERHPTTGVTLQVLNESDEDLALAKGVFVTRQGMRLSQNRQAPYWGTTHLVIQKLHELHAHGWNFVRDKAVLQSSYQGKRPVYRTPTNWEMVRWLSREAVAAAGRMAIRRLRPKPKSSWRIGIRLSATPLFEEGAGALASFRWYEAPPGRWFADSMAFQHNGRQWLFIEDFDEEAKKAVISVAEIRSDGQMDVVRPCLIQPYHLSYPLVFAHDGDIFMIPETSENERVELYRARHFPFEWKLEKVLAPFRAVDTTPLYHGGRWWFFTSIPEPRGWGALGFLFTAAHLTGEWSLHPSSPISSSSLDARNAGPILQWGTRLLRSTQSAFPVYGYSFSFHEITQLDPHGFTQQTLTTIDPAGAPPLLGTHTYSRAGDLEVIDGFMPARERLPEGRLYARQITSRPPAGGLTSKTVDPERSFSM